jgi:hypothetical protein
VDQAGIYGYGLNNDAPLAVNLPLASANRLHKTIRENFSTLVFCRRYLDRLGLDRYLAGVSISTFQKPSVLIHADEQPYFERNRGALCTPHGY